MIIKYLRFLWENHKNNSLKYSKNRLFEVRQVIIIAWINPMLQNSSVYVDNHKATN